MDLFGQKEETIERWVKIKNLIRKQKKSSKNTYHSGSWTKNHVSSLELERPCCDLQELLNLWSCQEFIFIFSRVHWSQS